MQLHGAELPLRGQLPPVLLAPRCRAGLYVSWDVLFLPPTQETLVNTWLPALWRVCLASRSWVWEGRRKAGTLLSLSNPKRVWNKDLYFWNHLIVVADKG